MVAGALHEQGHLVRHLPDVGPGTGQHGQAGALARGRHQEEPRGHLDDRLTDAAAEVPARAPGQGLEPRGERGQVIGIGLLKPAGGADRQAILGQEHRAGDVRNAQHQVIQEPVELPGRRARGAAVDVSLH